MSSRRSRSGGGRVSIVVQRERGALREGAGDDALAGAVLAGDEDVRVRGTDAVDDLDHGTHRRRLRDQLRPTLVAQDAFQPLPLPQSAAELRLGLGDGEETLVVPRLPD